MKSFMEFIDHKKLEKSIIETANLMVEMDIDPEEFIMEYISKSPEVEEKFLRYIELKEGIIGNLWQGARDFASNVWSGGGVTGGWAQAKDTVAGPLSKFNTAVKVLGDLVNSLRKSDQTKDMKASDGNANLADYIERIKNALLKQQQMIPRMQRPANTQPKMGQMQQPNPAAANPAAANPAAANPAAANPAAANPAAANPAAGIYNSSSSSPD